MPDRLHRLGLVLLVGLTVLLLLSNHLGVEGPGRIQAWWADYAGGGSCARRPVPSPG